MQHHLSRTPTHVANKIDRKMTDEIQSPATPLGDQFRMSSMAVENEAMRNTYNNLTTADGERFATFGKSMMTTANGLENLSSGTYDNNPSSYVVGGGQISAEVPPSNFNANQSSNNVGQQSEAT